MTPNDLAEYLAVMTKAGVASAAMLLPSGAQVSVTFMPAIPLPVGSEPEPGGWKSPMHLDNPSDLREDDSYKGDLP